MFDRAARLNCIDIPFVVANMKIRLPFGLAVILGAAAGAACDIRVSDKGGVSVDVNEGGRAEDTWTRSYTVTPGGRFELDVRFSSIEILPAAGKDIDVVATRKARGRSDEAARDLLKQFQMKEEIAPDRVRLEPSRPEGAQFFGVQIEYQVKVPPGLQVVVKNEYGSVKLDNVQGRFDLSVTNGRLSGKSVSGGLQAHTINGQVIMQMTAVTDDIRITTVNGAAVLGLPPNLNATVEATTINGGITVRDSLPLVTSTKEPQRLSGRLGTGKGPRIELQTTNGGVRLGGGEPPT